MLATTIFVLSSGFVVSATSVMSDVPMLCLWLWSMAIWFVADEQSGPRAPLAYLAAGLLMTAAALCKYPALQLVPLLAITALKRRHLRAQVAALLMPVIAVLAFQWISHRVYGSGYVSVAATYAANQWLAHLRQIAPQVLVALSFVAGAALPAGLVLIVIARSRWVIAWVVAIPIAVGVLRFSHALMPLNAGAQPRRAMLAWQFAVLASLGAAIIIAAISQLRRCRDRSSLLLALWIIGVFVFAAIVNWSINVRSLLPMLPALAIVAARQLDASSDRFTMPRRIGIAAALAISTGLAAMVAAADYSMASASRRAAELIHYRARDFHGTIWFLGHWGFQWYMEQLGAKPFDLDATIPAGGLVVIPMNNTNLFNFPEGVLQMLDEIKIDMFPYVSTQNAARGAGFYTGLAGPMPFALGPTPPEQFYVCRLLRTIVPAPTTQPAK
jgi:hypothetical protein